MLCHPDFKVIVLFHRMEMWSVLKNAFSVFFFFFPAEPPVPQTLQRGITESLQLKYMKYIYSILYAVCTVINLLAQMLVLPVT